MIMIRALRKDIQRYNAEVPLRLSTQYGFPTDTIHALHLGVVFKSVNLFSCKGGIGIHAIL